MRRLSKASDIWVLKPDSSDREAGAHYASLTLGWTFNRMMFNLGSSGQKSRALNIAKGIVSQEVLRRAFRNKGITAPVQNKSHRDEDLFDFRFAIEGKSLNLDLKSVNFFSDYAPLGRQPLSSALITQCRAYPGPDWRTFFPMLVPHTQINQSKDMYCFAVASSIDFRQCIDTNRDGYALTAFPYGEAVPFFSNRRLCLAREAASEGFYLSIEYTDDSLLESGPITLTVVGEWNAKVKEERVSLKRGQKSEEVGPFSCVACFQVDRKDFGSFVGQISIEATRNDFCSPVLNAQRKDTNKLPETPIVLTTRDFCNLILPSDYTLYFIGWIFKKDFLERCRKYKAWVWPKDSISKYENQLWSQVTEKDIDSLTRAGFGDCIQRNPSGINAGWMKTNGRGGGACCYAFPNIGMRGGVKETNLYVLPEDLYTMDSLLEL